eukprot:296695-Prymnesium_polylepis.1
MLRGLSKVAPRVATASRPSVRAALVGQQRTLAGPVVDIFPPRTPERTAELERLAEEHNGFLFGEVVRDDAGRVVWWVGGSAGCRLAPFDLSP